MSSNVTKIKPARGISVPSLPELWRYRDLFFFLVWKDIKARYAQSVLGIGWAVIQPLMFMIVFTLIFGRLAKIGSDGVPYAIFSYTAVVPWTFFSRSLMDATASLTKNSAMVTKIYFPRVILPLTSVLGKLVDFGIALILVSALMAWFHMIPTYWAFMLPVFVLIMIMTAAGMGMWLTAMAVQFRDVEYASTFVIQLMMYAAPVVYPASLVPDNLRLVYGINPLAGVIEGFRSALLGTNPMPWDLITIGSISAVVIMITGAVYFRRMERYFADVV